MTTDVIRRAEGSLLGLAVGDALGAPLEFVEHPALPVLTEMTGGGAYDLDPGQWTDDTSLAICIAESLTEVGFNLTDQMQRFCRYWHEGYNSSRPGECFDIGGTTRRALARFEQTGSVFAGVTDFHTSANGSLMRLAPIPIAFWRSPTLAVLCAEQSSRVTHVAPLAVDACRYYAALIVGALNGATKAQLLDEGVPAGIAPPPLTPAIGDLAQGLFKRPRLGRVEASGFVVHTLDAALWAFWSTTTFEDGAIRAVNLGQDADTTGAVYGQLAGAYYGVDAIPARWLARALVTSQDKFAMAETV